MKRKIWLHHLIGAVFAFVLSVSTVGCLATGFNLPVSSISMIFLRCGLLSLIFSFLFRFKIGAALTLCMTTVAAVLGWREGSLPDQLQTLAVIVTSHYHEVYGWRILGSANADQIDLVLIALGWWTSLSVSYCICRRKHIMTALPSVIIPVVLCLVTIDTVPDVIYLYLLIFGVALMLITDWVRRTSPDKSAAFTIRMAIAVSVMLALLFFTNPQATYVNKAYLLYEKATSIIEDLQSPAESFTGNISSPAVSSKLNLRSVGPKSELTYSVMLVTSPIGGTIYLRGQDYDQYTGLGWEATEDRSETFSSGDASAGKLTIVTYGVRTILYVPYYATESVNLSGGSLENSQRLQTYDFYLSREPAGYTASFESGYTNLPYDTYQWASILADDITSASTSEKEAVQAICSYVKNSASYDLATSRMSYGHDDFAQWFLEESETGYCVHFATAATVLLRAAGIPARYVEGYMITCQDGEKTVVTNKEAHAWAEYYDSDSSVWRVLEATPADSQVPAETESQIPATSVEALPTVPGDDNVLDVTIPHPSEQSPGEELEPIQIDEPFKFPGWIKTVLCIVLILAAIPIQGELRIVRIKWQWNRGNPNEMTCRRYQQLKRMVQVMNTSLPDDLEDLAQKAMFSQHTMTMDELEQFTDFKEHLVKIINSSPWYKKYFLRWIIAIG